PSGRRFLERRYRFQPEHRGRTSRSDIRVVGRRVDGDDDEDFITSKATTTRYRRADQEGAYYRCLDELRGRDADILRCGPGTDRNKWRGERRARHDRRSTRFAAHGGSY